MSLIMDFSTSLFYMLTKHRLYLNESKLYLYKVIVKRFKNVHNLQPIFENHMKSVEDWYKLI